MKDYTIQHDVVSVLTTHGTVAFRTSIAAFTAPM